MAANVTKQHSKKILVFETNAFIKQEMKKVLHLHQLDALQRNGFDRFEWNLRSFVFAYRQKFKGRDFLKSCSHLNEVLSDSEE